MGEERGVGGKIAGAPSRATHLAAVRLIFTGG
jgi:hypothetical protein